MFYIIEFDDYEDEDGAVVARCKSLGEVRRQLDKLQLWGELSSGWVRVEDGNGKRVKV